MKARSFLALGVSLLFTLALVDCGGTPPQEEPEECEEISSLCHAAEDISEEAADCHEQAHEGDLELCLDIRDECIALCEGLLGIGGAGGAGGATH